MKKQILLYVSVLFFCLMWIVRGMQQETRIMEASVISIEEASRLQKTRTPFQEDSEVCLQVNQVTAAWERAEKRYYIPKNIEEKDFKGHLGALANGQPATVVWLEDPAFSNICQAIADQHIFWCLVYNEHHYQRFSVLFTGLPVMTMDGEMGEAGSRMALFDPVLSYRGGYQTEESLAYYNIRGNASKRFEKLGYRLELFYDDGSEGRDLSFLGMRSDNDWQLKAMYSDRSKLRDKLSIDLWNQIAEQTSTPADDGCHMEYLELLINGEYQGLYGLVEPTDYKSLQLDKERDLIYKVASDEWPEDALFDASEAEQSFVCAGVNIRQSSKTYYPGIWEPFRTFWNSGYEMESAEDLDTLYACIDRQNFINYDLYYNVIAGMDNRFKNIIYSTTIHADGTYTIRRVPWDQNYSWGDDFEKGEDKDIKNIRYNRDLYKKWLNEEVFRNMQAYDKQLSEDLRDTWKTWRQTFLKEEYWKSYAKEQMAYLVDSGAFARDTVRWPDSENQPGTQEIEDFIDARFSWLDEYLSFL